MDSFPAPSPPLPNLVCPLCGGPNGCALAASGRVDTPCWCSNAKFSDALLARVPADQRRLSRICSHCAQARVPPAAG